MFEEEGNRAPDGHGQAIRGGQLTEDLALKIGISMGLVVLLRKKIPIMEVCPHISWPRDLSVLVDLL